MPCESIRTTSVALDKCSPEHMMNALRSLGLSPWQDQGQPHLIYFGSGETINCQTGQSQLGTRRDINEIKRAYSGAVVQATARKFGWTPQQVKVVEGQQVTTYNRR